MSHAGPNRAHPPSPAAGVREIAPDGEPMTLTLSAAGCEIEYRWAGRLSQDQPCIVLLHEGLGSVAMWKTFPERLARRTGCAVFVYSREGYGRSSPLSRPRQPDYMHHEGEVVLPAVLDAAQIEQAVLFGHSDGASIALIGAATHPKRVTGLVLEAPHVFVEPLTLSSIAESKRIFETTDLCDRLARYHHDPRGAFWGWNDIWLDGRFEHWNIEFYLPRITCPTLLIQGREDNYGTLAQLDSIAERSRGPTQVVVLDRCGHAPHRDRAEAVLAEAQAFTRALGSAAPA